MILYLSPAQRRIALGIGLGVVLAVGLTALVVRSRDKTKDVRILAGNVHNIIGEVAVQETIKLIGRDARVVLITADTTALPDSPAASELAGFMAATNQYGRLTVVATPVVITEATGAKQASVLTGTQFLQLVKQYPDIDVIVSLVGPPELSANQIQAVPRDRPAVVAVLGLTYRTGLKPLFRADMIQVAIVPRSGRPPAGPRPQTAREWFDYSFQVVTTKTADSLPD